MECQYSVISHHFTHKDGTEHVMILVIISRCPKRMTLCVDESIIIIGIIIILLLLLLLLLLLSLLLLTISFWLA